MRNNLVFLAVAGGALCGPAAAMAQQNQNPMGLDYGPFHPAVPSQVTTYFPPAERPTVPRRHHRMQRPIY